MNTIILLSLFIRRVRPSTRFLDPHAPPPSINLYMTTFSTITNKISIYLGLG